MHRKSRTGRVGLYLALQGAQEGAFGKRSEYYAQSYGPQGSNRGPGRCERALCDNRPNRLEVRQGRNYKVDSQLESQWLGAQGQGETAIGFPVDYPRSEEHTS